MAHVRVRGTDRGNAFTAGFDQVRERLGLPNRFPAAVQQATIDAIASPAGPGASADRLDRRDLPFITIDPDGSRDLDQAFFAERLGDGHRVFYAIADVATFVAPGDPIDVETRERGVTLYAPDQRVPLHPAELSEGAASLLPDQDRPAVLWTIDLDGDGELLDARAERALVRSRAMRSYASVDEELRSGSPDELFGLLEEIGTRREALTIARGAVHLDLPSQEVVAGSDGHFHLEYEASRPIENWNAQISLLTGIAGARIMVEAGRGLLRTLPEPDDETLAELKRVAAGLGVSWDDGAGYADRIRMLDRREAAEAALLTQCARLFRGAGYLTFEGDPGDRSQHSAIASHYAHVTAPLRRMCDRFTNEVLLAICADAPIPAWATEALDELPSLMNSARGRESTVDRAMVDVVEAVIMSERVGETFTGVVTNIDRSDAATVQLREPAVVAKTSPGSWTLGAELEVRIETVELNPPLVLLAPVSS